MLDQNIKIQIRSVLDALVTSGTLACVVEVDVSKNFFQLDIPSYPVAVLGTSSIQSAYETNRANQRTYKYTILFAQQYVNITTQRDMEILRDKVLNAFDNKPTLNGASDVASDPATSEIASVSTADKTFVVFDVTLKARALANLSF